MMLADLRQAVIETARKMKENGLVELAGGTVCAVDKETSLVAITPSGMEYDDMQPEDVCLVNYELELVDGTLKPSVASDMFTEIIKARPDIGAVIHTHSSYATAFASVNKEIPVITTTQANLVGGPVPVVRPLHPGPHTKEYLDNIVKTLGNGKAVNLMCHGPIVVGDDLDDCLAVAVTIESTAAIAIKAAALGDPVCLSQDDTLIAYNYCRKAVGQKNHEERGE